jgi:GGDEF domain-containing protein
MSTDAASALVERVLAVTPLGQTFSAGIAAWTGSEAPDRLVGRADEALYQAKRTGRDRVVVHSAHAPAVGAVQPTAL